MNKLIKNYIEEADYDELLDIMECANNRIMNVIAKKENAWEWIFYIIKLTNDYKERLHLMATPHEQYQCNCSDYYK